MQIAARNEIGRTSTTKKQLVEEHEIRIKVLNAEFELTFKGT